jgi:hypothetical protein
VEQWSHHVPGIELNQAQHDFLNHALDGTPGAIPRDPWEDPNANAAFRVALEGGGAGVFKPETGESGTGGLYGPMWQNEIGAYRLDQALGFNLVPTTAPFQGADANGSSSIGSIQAWAPNSRLDPGGYDTIDQQKMGVLDYILGNGDRHLGNWLTQADGRPAAIDNGLTFPTSNAENLRSDFVRNVIGQQKRVAERKRRPAETATPGSQHPAGGNRRRGEPSGGSPFGHRHGSGVEEAGIPNLERLQTNCRGELLLDRMAGRAVATRGRAGRSE